MTGSTGSGKAILAWMVFLGLLTWGFSGLLDHQRNPNREVVSSLDSQGRGEVRLQRNRSGHYLANGAINGQPVTFLVDTGATTVTIPADLARRLALRRGPAFQAQTANGTVTVYQTTLDTVTLGAIALHDVRASINPGMGGDEVLLGMSFLRGLELVQRDGELLIRQ